MTPRGVLQRLPNSLQAAVVRRLAAASHQGWRSARGAWRAAQPPRDPLTVTAAAERQGLLRRFRTRRVAVVLLVVCVLVASCGLLNVSRVVDGVSVARDARAQVSTLRALAHGGGLSDVATLQAIQVHVNRLASDLQRLQTDVPAEAALAHIPGVGGPVHVLRMASDLVGAGQAALPALIVLAPQLKPLLSSVQGSASQSAATAKTASPVTPPTVAQLTQAGQALNAAGALLLEALAERAYVSDTDLSLLGLGSVLPLLHQLDPYAANAPKFLSALHALTANLPLLLGVPHPTTFALFDLDSDELRATGGFMGNYALLTLDGARLTSGVHLNDIYSLDCPNGGVGYCPVNPIPHQFAWLQTDPTQFGLRDSNVDPDYPTSAQYAEQWLVHDGAPAVAGVLSLTPAVIEQLLQYTGPLSLPSYCAVVTAENLRELIHYFHIATSLGITTLCPGHQPAAASNKAFDAALGSELLHRAATLPAAQQSPLVQALFRDFLTGDVQLYLNNPDLEAVLTSFGVDGTVRSPRGDSLFVVDANTDATYANADVQEHVADTVTLDDHGGATHDVTVTYAYPKASHLYTDVWEDIGGYWSYRDFVRVIVPPNATLLSQQGCAPYSTTELNHAVWSCIIAFGQPNGLTLHFKWNVPHAATAAGGVTQYRLWVQHQAGAHVSYDVIVMPPPDHTWSRPPQAPLVASSDHQAQFTSDLPESQQLVLEYNS